MKLLKKVGLVAAMAAFSGSVMAAGDTSTLKIRGYVLGEDGIKAIPGSPIDLTDGTEQTTPPIRAYSNRKDFIVTVSLEGEYASNGFVSGELSAPVCIRLTPDLPTGYSVDEPEARICSANVTEDGASPSATFEISGGTTVMDKPFDILTQTQSKAPNTLFASQDYRLDVQLSLSDE